MTPPAITFVGDSCLSVSFDAVVDPAINACCAALAAALHAQQIPGVRDIVPGFYTVSLYFDPLRVDRDVLAADIRRAVGATVAAKERERPPLEIAVRYGGAEGPDLAAVAAFAGCSEAEVIRIHSAPMYRVYMLGFLPGFAYLGTVDRRIAMPRLEAPRSRVPAGSVGIAASHTAVYPCDTPGGWRILGRAAVAPFDLNRAEPSLFNPGQRIRFVAA
jgi:inhibitor of KinA